MKGSREQTEGQGSYSGPLCHEQTLLATRTPLIMLKLMAYKVKTLYLGILLSSSGTTCRFLRHSHIPLSKISFVTFSLVDLLLGRGSAPLQEAGRPQLVRGKHGLEHSTCKELCPVNENRVSKLCTKMEKNSK